MALTRLYSQFFLFISSFFLVFALTACRSAKPPVNSPALSPDNVVECRFLVTFDDGPSHKTTAVVLDLLKLNAVQTGIKAIFFVQTRSPRNGGSDQGRLLMQREHAEGHILALHSGSARGHVNHTKMHPPEFQQSLADGIADITAIAGGAPLFVRPPFWRYNAETLARYENNGLNMILSDVKTYDGGSGNLPLHSRLRSQRQGSMLSELQRVKKKIDREEIPAVNGIIPIIVTFHDTNQFTVNHLEEWMQILVQEAGRAGLKLSGKPFYDSREEVEKAALERAERRVTLETRLPARISRFFKRS